MAGLLTFYDDDQSNNFIECTICDRRIRGETQYKLHLTTLQHLKKEEALAAQGLIPSPQPLPEWTDIKQYLKYLNLDEPIIGLSCLVQEYNVVLEDGKVQLRYRCKMCGVEMDMCTMVSHVVSRKHRMKYLQLKRPDLVTWQNDTVQKQPGLVARAKAALVEKQEGWGTPVALRTSWSKRLKKNFQGHGTIEGPRPSTRERSYSGRKSREQSPRREDGYRRSYLADDLGRPSRYPENDLDDRTRDNATLLQPYPQDDGCEMTYQDNRKRPYRGDDHTERPFSRGNHVGSFLEDVGSGRRYAHTIQEGSYNEHQNKRYTNTNPTRGWNSSGDVQGDICHDGVTKNRFADLELSGRARHTQEMGYQEDQFRMYTSHEGRGKNMDELKSQARGFQYTEKRQEHAQELEQTAMSMSFELQDYTQRHRNDLGDYSQNPVPAKRKRKSRFSDATPLEMAITQKRLIDCMVPKRNPKTAVPTRSQWSENRLDSDMTRASVNTENVLDMLDDIRIENMEEANFVKEKLCNLLKEFHAKKAQHTEQNTQVPQRIRDYHHGGEEWMDQHSGMQDPQHLDDQGFKETTRYECDFQEDRRHLQETRGYEKESAKCDNHHRDFQNSSTSFQRTRLEDSPRDFEQERYFGDGPLDIQQARRFENPHKEFKHGGHFQSEPLSFQQARNFEESRRTGQVADISRSFQNFQHSGSPREHGGYEEGARRGAEKGIYIETDFRHSQSSLDTRHEIEWHSKRGGSADQSKGLEGYADDDRRAYQESLWKSDADLYDPFQPSSSPPREMAPPSSLEKLASTLLELVARKSNK